MSRIVFDFDWIDYPDDNRNLGVTTARLKINLGNKCITHNESIWSKTTQDYITVSLYPLAMWIASSWWRLNYEVLPNLNKFKKIPSHDWRMSHEMSASNEGFIWPNVMFATDFEMMHVWADKDDNNREDSVKYLSSTNGFIEVSKDDFFHSMFDFIKSIIARLNSFDIHDTHLEGIWELITEDMSDPLQLRKRRIEARFGYDPEDISQEIMQSAMQLEDKLGLEAFAELAGVYGESAASYTIEKISETIEKTGIIGKPSFDKLQPRPSDKKPWQYGINAARILRETIGGLNQKIDTKELLDLLGLPNNSIREWAPAGRPEASVAQPLNGQGIRYIPRKKHVFSQRFEMARFIGDYARFGGEDSWLVNTDLATARQKYQRAFAAEFLCPIDSLKNYLGGDFSESAIEDASQEYQVGEQAISAVLMNNELLEKKYHSGFPYRLSA